VPNRSGWIVRRENRQLGAERRPVLELDRSPSGLAAPADRELGDADAGAPG